MKPTPGSQHGKILKLKKLLLLPFRAFCVEDLKISMMCGVWCRLSVLHNHRRWCIIGHHHRRLRSSYEDIRKNVHFRSFMCVVGTVVSSKMLSCSLLEKGVKDDVSIERYLSSKSEIGHRNHKSSQSSTIIEMIYNDCSHYLSVFCMNMVRSTQKS